MRNVARRLPWPGFTRGAGHALDEPVGLGIVEPSILDQNIAWEELKRRAALAELEGTVNLLRMDREGTHVSIARVNGRSLSRGRGDSDDRRLSAAQDSYGEGCVGQAHGPGPEVGLVIDILHLVHNRGCWADLAALKFHAQISDGLIGTPWARRKEAVFDSGSLGV